MLLVSIIFLPLLRTFSVWIGGRLIGPICSVNLSSQFIIIVCGLSLITLFKLPTFDNSYIIFVEQYKYLCIWIHVGFFKVQWLFLFDRLSVTILVIVSSISRLVHVYRGSYIAGDAHHSRFMSYLSLFTFFILILVSAGNFLQLFVGWEGVGLCSYLLINFWFTRIQANKAAIKAILINRVADIFLVLALLIIFRQWGSLDFAVIFPLVPLRLDFDIMFFNTEISILPLVLILLFFGAIGKSAQIFLHTWLPDAIEGPTPVSALIHAATIVTAGVFLLIRISPMLEFATEVLNLVIFIGATTAFIAATVGLLQRDIKRVIAYSTCSQLGYMIFACGISAYPTAMFHLRNHAFFKALLFLGAGSVIHALSDEQDIRRIGGLKAILPLTYRRILIGSLSLIGIPFLTGFYSKDVIIELAFRLYSTIGLYAYFLGVIAAFFTAFYRIRLLYLTFLSPPKEYRALLERRHESTMQISLPLVLLSIGAILIGYRTKDLMIGGGTNYWSNAIFVLPYNSTLIEAEFLITPIKILPVVVTIFRSLLAFCFYTKGNYLIHLYKVSNAGRYCYTFLNRKWLFDAIYTSLAVQVILQQSYNIFYKQIDRNVFELSGPLGLSSFIDSKGTKKTANSLLPAKGQILTSDVEQLRLGLCFGFCMDERELVLLLLLDI